MYPSGIDVDAVAHAVRRLLRLGILGAADGKLASEDEMRCQAVVRMWSVMCISNVVSF
jgi:hypothetical protein